MTFFSRLLKILNSYPYLRENATFPPLFRKIYNFLHTIVNLPAEFAEFTCFGILYVFLVCLLLCPRCIYASYNARTGRPWFWHR